MGLQTLWCIGYHETFPIVKILGKSEVEMRLLTGQVAQVRLHQDLQLRLAKFKGTN